MIPRKEHKVWNKEVTKPKNMSLGGGGGAFPRSFPLERESQSLQCGGGAGLGYNWHFELCTSLRRKIKAASEAATETPLAPFAKAGHAERSRGTRAFTESVSACQHMPDIGPGII